MKKTDIARHTLALALVALTSRATAANGPLGLYPSTDFQITDGRCVECPIIAQAKWYFQDQVIAAPLIQDGGQLPPLVWLGAPDVHRDVRLAADGTLTVAGTAQAWQLTPRLASNRSWFNADSSRFFAGRPLSVRSSSDKSGRLEVRAFWPADFALPLGETARPLQAGENLKTLVQADSGGAKAAFQSRVLWQRSPDSRWKEGQAVLGLMLNGAQGDDDEAHGGHFAVFTGQAHADGHMQDWLVNNFYNLDSVSEKGILAAVTPLDSYLADLNGGQSWYRPSYMLVAVLKDGRNAHAYQTTINQVFQRFYRHQLVYDHSRANCTGISVDALRAVGWNLPEMGPTGRLKSLAAYAYVASTERSLESGRKIYDYLNEEQTRLYPAQAFDAAGQDLLRLVSGNAGRALSDYEQRLVDDVEAIVWVRVPQFPSSRAFGQAPIYSFDEFLQRTPKDRSEWKIVPTGERHFPEQWREKGGPALPAPVPAPVAAVAAVLLGVVLFPLWWWLRRRRARAQQAA